MSVIILQTSEGKGVGELITVTKADNETNMVVDDGSAKWKIE